MDVAPGPLFVNLFRTIDPEMVLYKYPLCVRLFMIKYSETLIVKCI